MSTDTKEGQQLVPLNPVVEVAKERRGDDIRTLKTGVRVKLNPVPASLVDAVTSRIPEPEIPIWVNEDGHESANPLDPQYEKDVAEANRKRGLAAIDALTLFGVDLLDGLPPDSEWLTKLEYMEKMGLIDVLGEYDLTDPVMKELVYKKYVGVTSDVIEEITKLSGLTPEEVTEAEESFPGN